MGSVVSQVVTPLLVLLLAIIQPSMGVIIHGPRPTAAAGATIAIDASGPIRFTGTPAQNVDITSASFTPPANSVLVICVSADTTDNTSVTITSSVTNGTTPVARIEKNGNTGSGTGGYAGIFTSVLTTSTSMTVSARYTTVNGSNGSKRMSVVAYVVTAANTTTPNGTTQSGTSTVNNLTTTAYTSSVNNSRGFACGSEWNALGAGSTDPTSTDTGNGKSYSAQIDTLSCYKASNTASSGSSVTLNLDAAGSSAAIWHWVALEIVP